MPLVKRARIEIYLPDAPAYADLQSSIEQEFLYTFGGCTVIGDIKGLYLAAEGSPDRDKVNLIYADCPFDFETYLSDLSVYADEIGKAALTYSMEESILVVVHEVYHSIV